MQPDRFIADDGSGGGKGGKLISPALPPLSAHPAAKSVVARKMMQRLTDDLQWLKDSAPSAPPQLQTSIATVTDLIEQLTNLVDQSTQETDAEVPYLVSLASEGGECATDVQKLSRGLAIATGSEPNVSLELLCELLMSSDGEEVLKDLNPLLSDMEAYELLERTSSLLLSVNRAAHAARALAMAKKLLKELKKTAEGGEAAVLAEQLAAALVVHRAHVVPSGDDANPQHMFDPRLLLFEFSTGFVLRPPQVALVGKLVGNAQSAQSVCHQMLMGEGKTTVISPLLALLLGATTLVIQIVPPQLLAFALDVLRGCFASAGASEGDMDVHIRSADGGDR